MPLESYINAFKQSEKEIYTVEIDLAKSFIAATETITGEDNLIDRHLLKDPAKRNEYVGKIVSTLEGSLAERYDSFQDLDEFRKAELMAGRYGGLTTARIIEIVDKFKDEINPDLYKRELWRNMRAVNELFSGIPRSNLTEEDAEEVADYVEACSTPGVQIDPTKLTIDDMDYLLRTIMHRGAVTLENIDGRNYQIPPETSDRIAA